MTKTSKTECQLIGVERLKKRTHKVNEPPRFPLQEAGGVLCMTAPCKRRPFVLYDKAKLSEFYLQEENLEKIIAEMG